ncbi:hypothetical protein [Aquimarina longa]|uniref:hypothetical protein n=1 Tax=Aquimarina longa TaxID=1080221 RepID=UPI00078332CD|nr:hypothetical protein [Aquimarina longa]
MNNWLDRVRAPKYLRYFFYIAYSWYRPYKSDRSDAHFGAMLIVALPNTLLLFVINNISLLIDSKKFLVFSNTIVIFFSLIVFLIYYVLFIYDNKWKVIIKEFEYLKRKDRKRGLIYLFIYLFTWFFLALFPFILDALFGVYILEKHITVML